MLCPAIYSGDTEGGGESSTRMKRSVKFTIGAET